VRIRSTSRSIGPQRLAQEQEVRDQHHAQPDGDVDPFQEGKRGVDPAAREDEQQRREHEQGRVDREDPPQQR
jgi:hypothetical protein